MSIILRTKATTGAGAALLDAGELAVNLFDKSLYLGLGGSNQLLLGAPVAAGGGTHATLRWNGTTWVSNSNFTVDASGNITCGTVGCGAITSTSTIQGTVITATTNFSGNLTGNVTGNLAGDHTSGSITGTTGQAADSAQLGGVAAANFPQSTTVNTLTKAGTASDTISFTNVDNFKISGSDPVSEDAQTVTFVT